MELKRKSDQLKVLKHWAKMSFFMGLFIGLTTGMGIIREYPDFGFIKIIGGLFIEHWGAIITTTGSILAVGLRKRFLAKMKKK